MTFPLAVRRRPGKACPDRGTRLLDIKSDPGRIWAWRGSVYSSAAVGAW